MGANKKMQRRPPCSARGASFFKVMLGDFKRRLRVPPSFASLRVGKAQCKFILRSSVAGRSWHVEVDRVGNDLFFHSGWGKFLKDHMIDMGDFLVFTYDGNVGFTLHAYGSDGFKKEIFAKDNNQGRLPMKGAGKMIVHQYEQLNDKSSKELVGLGEAEPLRRGRIPPAVVGREKALEEALSFRPEHPYFVATWRKTCAYYMTIPSALVKEFDIGRKAHITLRDYLGRLWPVKVSVQGDGRVHLTNGWSKFSRNNHLNDGDACILEFMQEGDIIQSHIFKMEKRTGKVTKQYGDLLHGEEGLRQ